MTKPKIIVTTLEVKKKSTVEKPRHEISPIKINLEGSEINKKPSLMQAKKIKLNVSPLRQSPSRLILKKKPDTEFLDVDEEFEKLQSSVSNIMVSMGLNYSFEKIGQPIDISQFLANMLLFEDSMSMSDASPMLQTRKSLDSILSASEFGSPSKKTTFSTFTKRA